MRRVSVLLVCSLFVVGVARTGDQPPFSPSSRFVPPPKEAPEVSFKEPFMGTWEGCLSDWPFKMTVWQTWDATQATIRFPGCPLETLAVLGWKQKRVPETVLYLWRPADMTAISVLAEKGGMTMVYFERDGVRRIPLSRMQATTEAPEKLLKEYRGSTTLPPRLLEMYADLVGLFDAGKPEAIRKICVSDGVTITDMPREQANMGKHGEINLRFLNDGFDRNIQSVRQDSERECLIRTSSTALWFILTEDGMWRLKDYLDKPIL